MNDIVLSALINLFALFGARNGLDKATSLELISNYLRRFFGVRNPGSYVNLYNDLRDYYDDFPELDKDTIVGGVCGQLKSKLRPADQYSMLIRLMEFCCIGSGAEATSDDIFKNVAGHMEISDDDFADIVRFVSGNTSENVLSIPLAEGCGTLKTIFLKTINSLKFTYVGDKTVLMDDIPVMSGVFQDWQQSGVLKCKDFQPLYYSSIMARYSNWQPSDTVEMCGRDINFRFAKGGDNGMHNFSFTLSSGQLVAIMGGSGVGKSTLLSLLNGTIRPQEGSITINGHDITEPAAKSLIGFVPQDDLLIEDLTVYQNLWYTARLCFDSMSEEEIDRRVINMLVQLGLDAARDLKVGSPINKFISGGQRKRLNIALELIREPAILFLDEPTSGLSSTDTEKVINLLKEQTGKGKLIVVNIHQPSSDVYRLFDRLWVLDKGGYPIYDGNPIDAVSYFKTAADYADAQTSACPTCGNVNPEIVLNIVDEKRMDNRGQLTEHRRKTPQEWHELYLGNRGAMDSPQVSDVPPTDQKRPGRLKQTLIFLQRNFNTKLSNLQYILVTLFEAPVLAVICGVLTRYVPDSGVYTIMDNKNLVSYFFMAIIVSIFLGMSGSAEEIIKDKALLKREKFLNLSRGSYIWSKIIYMAGVCLVQTLLFILVGNTIMGVHGMFWIWWMILFVSALLSALIGLLLSQSMSSVVAIYITIPLLLIPQILLCGLVVHFDDLTPGSETGNVPVIGDVIPSRWAYEALAVASFSKNEYEKPLFEQERLKYSDMYYEQCYLYELQSQLETAADEALRGEPVQQRHFDIIKACIPQLAEVCEMEPYDGEYEYGQLSEWLNEAKSVLSHRSNATTLALDRFLAAQYREQGKEAFLKMKKDNYNLSLEQLVFNSEADHPYSVVGTHIVPRSAYIFLTPTSRCGRAPFYSGVKVLGHYEIETLWFNMGVMLLMCLLLSLCLFFNFPGELLSKDNN